MEHFIKFISFALMFTLSYCGEAPYPPEANLINTYSGSLPPHPPTYNNKWNAESPVHHEPESFSVQTGYEGYLIPSEPELTIFDLLKTAGLVSLLPTITKIGLKIAIKVGIWALGLVGLFLVGSLCTAVICAFTPLCTISFLGFRNFDQESVRSLINQDKLNSAAKFMAEALKKYRELNNTVKNNNEKTARAS